MRERPRFGSSCAIGSTCAGDAIIAINSAVSIKEWLAFDCFSFGIDNNSFPLPNSFILLLLLQICTIFSFMIPIEWKWLKSQFDL